MARVRDPGEAHLMSKDPHITEVGQQVPVRMFQSEDRLTIAVPMPGLEPEDITVIIDNDRISLSGEERGPRQHELDLFLAEWTVGPYLRELALPARVQGSLANATYGNGVLVVSVPKATGTQPSTAASFRLTSIGPGRGERVGHQGQDAQPERTASHVARKHGKDVADDPELD